MITRRLRNALLLARNPLGAAERAPSGSFRALKVALIADELTASCLSFECRIRHLTPLNYRPVLRGWRPDLLLVESTWNGYADSWRHRIATYPGRDGNGRRPLHRVVDVAKSLGIPTVFWCREDGVHFERFIDSARLFEHIFTVDETCIPRYRAAAPDAKTIATLMFAVQPRIHHCEGATYNAKRAVFMGTYCTLQHPQRRAWLDLLLNSASVVGVTAFDRNYHRREPEYRFPHLPWLDVRPSVPHAHTGDVYRRHRVSLNVNTVEDSATMFSRRLIEILACGSTLVTTPACSVDRYFREYCEVVEDAEQGAELFGRLQDSASERHLRERAMAGVACVHTHHTWKHRLERVLDAVGSASSSCSVH
jgi:hypothetical protein